MFCTLALCNNVTPVKSDGAAQQPDDEPQLEASSPDEVALVKFGYQCNMKLIEREQQYCTMQDINGNIETFDILESFPFTSASKKMSCLLQSRNTKKIIYYLKGAETVMESKIKGGSRSSLLESCENLAMDGLRTLAFAQKVLTQKESDTFRGRLRRAELKLKDQEMEIIKVQETLEREMDFLGVTGVEDKL